MARSPVSIPTTDDVLWQSIPTTDGNVGGPVFKSLSHDPVTGARTSLTHLPPAWHDPQLDWHPAVEESFKIAGWSRSGWRVSGTPSYIYRPAGLLHGPTQAERTLGTTFITRFDATTKIIRVAGGELDDPVGPEYSAEGLIWIPDIEQVERRPVASGPWAGTLRRELRRDAVGGGLVLLDLPPGWEGEGSRARGEVEEFVLSGTVETGGVAYTDWGYACHPAGAPAGRYATSGGAVLACWWAQDELA